MLNQKEIISIIIATLILAFSISLIQSWQIFLTIAGIVLLILLINISAKKIIGYLVDSEVEIKLWEIERYGFKSHHYFKKPIPAGLILPLVSKVFFFMLGNFVWMASLIFEVKPRIYRVAKRHGLYSFSEMTEYHIGIIAAGGIVANLICAVIAYFINQPDFARISIYFTLFNMIPASDLDGNKIFFGSFVMWSFLAALVLIGVLFSVVVI